MNLGDSCIGCIAQAEMWSAIIRGNKAAAGQNILTHPHPVCLYIDRGTSSISRTLRSPNQLHFHPMVLVWIHIPQQHGRPDVGIDDYVDLAVVEKITEG